MQLSYDGGMADTDAAAEYRGDDPCSLANAVAIVGEKWAFFVLREALAGATRFSEFRERLGIASDVLTTRLERLTGAGIVERREYREPGQRTRADYHLTDAGRRLGITILALQEWGDTFTPSRTASSVAVVDSGDRAVHVACVDERGRVVDPHDLRFVRT